MSDQSSSDASWPRRRRSLPTEEFAMAGNPNPMGVPFFRMNMPSLGHDQSEETASLLGSENILGQSSSSDTLSSKQEDVFPGSAKHLGYGTWGRQQEGITLTWRELNVYVPQKKGWFQSDNSQHRPFKRVLTNVSGAVRPGSLVALMGASGAGKSTLMNALAHRSAGGIVADGDILVNGHQVNSAMTSLAGYVHQDDLFVGSLTVKEHLTFMTRLRMDRRSTTKQRQARVMELLKDLGLLKVQNNRIGIPGSDKSLSGGERKRLAFATEILTDPPLLFCDEPTTGLDSFNARKMVKIMKDMATRGKTILCTIHQPSSEVFTMFDKLLLLAEGRVAYMGSSVGALEFLESLGHKCPSTFNPADYYIHTLAVFPGHETRSRERIRRICDNFAVSAYCKDVDITIQYQDNMRISNTECGSSYKEEIFFKNIPEKPGWLVQWWWLTWRALLDSYRNPAIHSIRIMQKVLIAFLIGICYTNVTLNQAGIQDIEGVLFIFITENTFPSLYGVLNIFPQEMPLFLREYKNGIYRSDTYYLSKMISLIPGFIVDPVVFCVICYWMVGLQRHFYHFAMTVLITIFTANTASACGSMFSAMFESIPYIMLFLIPFDVVLLISGGLFINLTSMPWFIGWVKYLSWFMYSNEALTITQWTGVTNITCEMPDGVPCIRTGEQVISEYAFEQNHLYLDFWLMGVLYFCFHIVGFVGLHLRAKRK
ncbi:protein scarlet-like isoform X1 [Eriocheir sinensis]|uniref:protein scarlet-like isoform X1 n=3 Tax=Eriocheir sinensis TaxID=95602 RepID=UPI0021C578A4|nr:protein scarlet-like isoform X1 [Eriocheir sinensis]XP_050698002.1 protein scarlet-like isoform X1 [Eriocheir sinensis]